MKPMTLEDYRLHHILLRPGGILLGAVNLRDWTQEEHDKDIIDPKEQGFELLTNWVAQLSFSFDADKIPYRFFAVRRT